MRSKAPLVMIEQMVMILVFALAAALCLQSFVLSDRISRKGEARGRAALECQTAAETIRSCGGDMGQALSAAAEKLGGNYEQGLLWLDYDQDWEPIDYDECGLEAPAAAYRLTASGAPAQVPGLEKASVWVTDSEGGEAIFQLEIAWQGEVSAHG